MIRCPNCEGELDYLLHEQTGFKEYKFFPDGSYEDLKEFYHDGGENNYFCPHCLRILTTDEEEAMEILRGD